ncbi:MAG TPA: PrsW family glutamic-type intramembrane protease, partial [Lacunisphaera sp.]|nr:PrsW family glutamic-type intramembrane protease [Lacunisphaera sp.]
MSPLRAFFYRSSRSRKFLWSFALGVLALGAGVGFHMAQQESPRADLLGERVLATAGLAALDERDGRPGLAAEAVAESLPKLLEALDAELAGGKVAFRDLIGAIPVLTDYFDAKGDQAAREIFRKHYSIAEADLASDYLAAWYGRDAKAYDRIAASAQATPPPPLANHVLGRLSYHNESYRTAYGHFCRDTDAATVRSSRFWATRALIEAKDFQELARLQLQPEYAPYFDSHFQLKLAIGQKDWPAILRAVPIAQLESYRDPVFLIAVLTGLAWGFFLAVFGDLPGLLSGRAALCLLALLAGMVSTTPTLYLVILTEDILNLSMGENLLHHFAFFTGGVAAREEVCKLLLFVPFLPILYRRDHELEVLIVASFVGLGFALEENVNYFTLSAASAAPGRFLSANFFHIALTGMNGLALYRVCTHGWRGLNQFLFVFPVTILAHGGYNTLLSSDQIETGSFWAMGVYILFAQYYLRTAHDLRPACGHRTFSLSGALVMGVSTVAAVVLAYQMA